MNAFDKYICLKTKCQYIYKNIYINRILAPMIYSFANSKEAGFRLTSSALIFCAADVRKLKFDSDKYTIFSTFTNDNRRDYAELYENVIKKLDDRVYVNRLSSIRHKFSFSIRSLNNLVKSLIIVAKLDLTPIQKWKFAVYTTYYCNTIDELEKMDLKPNKYLSTFNTSYLENLLTQFFKNRGVETYSLQEGIYHLFEKDYPMDVIQYENLETDNLLCWGQYSADEYKRFGIDESRLRVVGYPKSVKGIELKVNKPLRRCLVLLARDSYLTTNLNLIELLSAFTNNYDFYLKLHPAADYDFYLGLAAEKGMFVIERGKTINECLNNVDFDISIAVNTTAYYESLLRGLPSLRFFDGSYDLMKGLEDMFATSDEFLVHLKRLSEIDINLYRKDSIEMLKYVIGYTIDKYREVVLN